MTLSLEKVEKIAKLAKLSLDKTTLSQYQQELSNILALDEALNKVDTSDVVPLSHPLEIKQRCREDKISETNQREAMLNIAPKKEAGLYLVPQVIE